MIYYVFKKGLGGKRAQLWRVEGKPGKSAIRMTARYSIFGFRLDVPGPLPTTPESALAEYKAELQMVVNRREQQLEIERAELKACPSAPGEAATPSS